MALALAPVMDLPRYFFDMRDGTYQHRDQIGRELPEPEDARLAAISALPDIARQDIPDGDQRTVSIAVRDDKGVRLYSVSLALRGRWSHEGGALSEVVDALVHALDVAQEEGDADVAETTSKMLRIIGEELAGRVGRKAAGLKLN